MRSVKILLCLCLALGAVVCARAAESLSDLLAAVPAPPADLATALGWIREDRLVAPEALAFEARLAGFAKTQPLPAVTTATTTDAAAVAIAVAAYQSYLSANPRGKAPAQVLGERLSSLAQAYTGLKRRTSNPELVQDIREQELAAYRALFEDWKARRAPIVARAELDMQRAGAAEAIQDPAQRTAIAQYRQAMLGEVEALFGVTQQAIEAAAGRLQPSDAAVPRPGPSTLWDLMSNPR